MTIERLAKAIATIGLHLDRNHAELFDFDDTVRVIKESIQNDDPNIRPMVECVQAVMAAYLGDDLESSARHVINTVAQGGKAKRFTMNVVDGDHIGPWECIVRVNREPQEPAIKRPTRPTRQTSNITTLILPGGYKR